MSDGPGAAKDAPGPSRQAWIAAFRELCEQRGRSPAAVAADVDLDHLIAASDPREQELRLDQQAALAAAVGVALSDLLARAEEIDQREAKR
jgi:hypothetical protein